MANDVTSKVILGLDPSEFRRGIQQVDSQLKQTSRLFGNLGQAIGAAFAVSQIQAFTSEAIRLGSEMQTVSRGFARFGNEMQLEELRQATRGLVTDLELMKVAVQAGNFGIPIQEMGRLLEFATRRAAETGQSVDYLVQSIVTGIGRKSPLILDNLGISVTRLKEKFGGAALEAQSIADVSKAVSEIASEELGKMGTAIDTATDKMTRLATSWTNLKTKAGEAMAPVAGGVMDGITNMLEGLSTMGQGLNRLGVATGTAKPSDLIKKTKPMAAAAPAMAAVSKPAAAAQTLRKTLTEISLQAKSLGMVSTNLQFQDQVLRTALIPAYDEFGRMIKGAREQLELEAQQLQFASAVGAEFGVILSSAFTAAMNNGTSFFDELQNAIKNYVQQLAVAVATTLALSAIVSAFTGAPLGVAFRGVAQGTGLGGLFGEGGILNMNARVSGSDLLLGTQRSGTNYGRIGG